MGGDFFFFEGGSAHLPAPLPQGQLLESGSRLPLRAFLGEARGAERGRTWSARCSWGEGREERGRRSERREGSGGKSRPGPHSSPGPGPAPPGSPAPAAPGVRRGAGSRRDLPAPLHRRGPASGERKPSALPLLPSPPSSLPPSFLPSRGLARGGRGALPAVCVHACPPGRRRAPACPPRPLRPPPAPPGPGEAAVPSLSDVGRRDPGWISGAS